MRYEVQIRREGNWWMVAIPSLGGLTQSRRLEDAASEAIDFVVVDQDVAPSSVQVDITSIRIGDREFSGEIQDVTTSRQAARLAESDSRAKTLRLARELAAAEVPIRDIGNALGVSYQRAHQLVSS